MTAPVGLTPARFDVLVALTTNPAPTEKTQAWLRRFLGVARATMCEMLGELERLGWVVRSRDVRDRRTFRVALTRVGRELLDRAYELAVGTGWVPLAVESALTVEPDDDFAARDAIEDVTMKIRRFFGDTATFELYPWHPDDYLSELLDVIPGSAELLSRSPPHAPVDLPEEAP